MGHAKNNSEQLTIWQRFIFNTFIPRKYERNKFDTSTEKYWFYIGYFVLGISFAGWAFMPIFKITFILLAAVYIIVCPFYLIKLANKLILLPVLTVLFCQLVLYFHWHWGLSIFGYHFEKYICYVFLAGGVLALLRRAWNVLVWKALGNINAPFEV